MIIINNIKYIGLDLDGTLLHRFGKISKKSLDTLFKLQSQGKKLIICSGRSFDSAIPIIRQLKIDQYGGYLICFNGAAIYEFSNGVPKKIDLTSNVEISKEECEKIMQILCKHQGQIISYSDHSVSFYRKKFYNKYYAKLVKLKHVDDSVETPIKIILLFNPAYIQHIFDDVRNEILSVNSNLNVFTSLKRAIEITAMNANKGQALSLLFNYLNEDKETLIVFGDQANDISMFEYAHYSIAMGNAIDKLKNIAYDTTLKNTKDGVAVYLDKLFKTKDC